MAKITTPAQYRALAETFAWKPDTFRFLMTPEANKEAFLKSVDMLERMIAAIPNIIDERSKNRNARDIREMRKWLNSRVGIKAPERKPREIVIEEPKGIEYNFLCEHLGENAPTRRRPIRLFVEEHDTVLLTEMVKRCAAWDDDYIVEICRWEKRAVRIPSWMKPEDYPHEEITLTWWLGFGADMEWPESWYRKLTILDEETRFAVIKLLNQKSFRSEKRQEIRTRLVNWLNGEGMPGKWDFVNIRNEYSDREAKAVSHRIYWRP